MFGLRSRALPSSPCKAVASSGRVVLRSQFSRPAPPATATAPATRTYSSLVTLRRTAIATPTITARPSLTQLHPTTTTTTQSPSVLQTQTQTQTQTRPFSATSSLAVKRRTYNPSRRVQKRRHGFLARNRTRAGRRVLLNRRLKGRKYLSW